MRIPNALLRVWVVQVLSGSSRKEGKDVESCVHRSLASLDEGARCGKVLQGLRTHPRDRHQGWIRLCGEDCLQEF